MGKTKACLGRGNGLLSKLHTARIKTSEEVREHGKKEIHLGAVVSKAI